MYRLEILLLALVIAGASSAQTSTVYKHVDKDGKVTYSEKPPAKDDPKVEGKADGAKKLGVDNQRNVIKSYVPKTGSDGTGAARAFDKRVDRNNELRAKLEEAQRELEDAKAAFEAGRDPLDDEWQTVGAAAGRPARIPTEGYHQRVKALEQAVKNAEEKVKQAETAVRRGTS